SSASRHSTTASPSSRTSPSGAPNGRRTASGTINLVGALPGRASGRAPSEQRSPPPDGGDLERPRPGCPCRESCPLLATQVDLSGGLDDLLMGDDDECGGLTWRGSYDAAERRPGASG